MKQVCEYCRSHMDIGRAECRNCGAPMKYFHPESNVWRNPHFTQDLRSYQEITLLQSAYRG